jgi:hypothetical protein
LDEFALLYGLFDGILNQAVVPFIVKGLFGPHHGLYLGFQIIVAGFANIPVGQMEISPLRYRIGNGMLANITGKGLHE